MKHAIIKLIKKYYPIYKRICKDSGEKPCLLGCIHWMKQKEILLTLPKTNLPMLTKIKIQIIEYERDCDISIKGHKTRRQIEHDENIEVNTI